MKIELVLSGSERVSAEITPSPHTAHLLTLRLSPAHSESSQALNTQRLHARIKIEKKGKVQTERERFSLLQHQPLAQYQLESGSASLFTKQLIDTVHMRFPASWLKVNITSPSTTYDPSFCLCLSNKFNTQVTLDRKYTK